MEEWEADAGFFDQEDWEGLVEYRCQNAEQYPDDPKIQHSLLDALFAIGKDETAINWIIKPNILRLDNNILDYCYNFLKTKRKPRTVHELYLELCCEGYPAFDDNQLMDFLLSDNRFVFTGSTDKSYDCFVSAIRKSNN
jgi:hypothetical protein